MSDGGPSGDYVGCVAGNLRAASRVVTRLYDAALREHGLRITQVALLTTVRRLQPVSLSVLAGGLASERSAVARDLVVLERAGLVVTGVGAGDKRTRSVRLTGAGEAKLHECAPAWHAAQQRIRDVFGEERAGELVRLANQLVAALDGI